MVELPAPEQTLFQAQSPVGPETKTSKTDFMRALPEAM